MDALTALYDKVSIDGFVIIDDYGEESWTSPLQRVDPSCYFWQRTS